MKAAPFRYEKPSTIAEALSLKAEAGPGARFIAGGQSLLPVLAMRLDRPDLLIDINGFGELEGVTRHGASVHVGALTRTKAIGRDPLVAEALPLLARCVEHIAHPAIRTRGTFGGSVALADPAAEWPAACVALDGRIVLRSLAGERAVPASEFFLGFYTTAIDPNELLVRVEFPVAPPGIKAVALELARRRGDYAAVGLLAQGRAADGGLADVATTFFGVSDRPIRLKAVDQALGSLALEEARAAIDAGLDAHADLYHAAATKTHLAKVLLGRAVEQLRH